MLSKIKKIIFTSTLVIFCLVGCGNKASTQVVEVPYDPYGFTPREFLEEGGWEIAKNTANESLPYIFCETLNIVLNPEEQYEEILTLSGNSYDFGSAEMKCAVFSKPSAEDEEVLYSNRLDVIYEIPVEQDGIKTKATFSVIFTNITRSKNKEYNCVSVEGVEDLVAYLECKEGIKINSQYIENNSEVKEPLDYGILYCADLDSEEDSVYKGLFEYTQTLEEERINTYLIEHTHNNSAFFATNDNGAYSSTCYTTEFDEEKIVADLSACAKNYGIAVYTEPLPTKEKKIEKENWSVYPVTYNTQEENGRNAQSYLKQCVRDVYVLNENHEISFLISYDEQTADACISIYYREKQEEKKNVFSW